MTPAKIDNFENSQEVPLANFANVAIEVETNTGSGSEIYRENPNSGTRSESRLNPVSILSNRKSR